MTLNHPMRVQSPLGLPKTLTAISLLPCEANEARFDSVDGVGLVKRVLTTVP